MSTATGYICPLEVGDQVEKCEGDYTFTGTVVAVFTKQSGYTSEMVPVLSGPIRFVVQNHDGILHIFSRKNLRKL